MSKFILLGTSACHLCEQAEVLLDELKLSYQKIDIAEEEQWQARYAIKIPVLLHTQSKQELCWPFDQADIQEWINK